MPKYKVTVLAKDYWTVEIEAEDEVEAEDLATDMCQAELLDVSEKEKVKPHSHLKYRPLQSANCEVFTCRANCNGVSFISKLFYSLE